MVSILYCKKQSVTINILTVIILSVIDICQFDYQKFD